MDSKKSVEQAEINDKSIEIADLPVEMIAKGEWCPGEEAIEPMIMTQSQVNDLPQSDKKGAKDQKRRKQPT